MFSLFKSKDKVKKHNHLINLVALAKSDGVVDENEKKLLKKIAIQNGISDKAFLAILSTSEQIDIDVKISKEERLIQLFDFIQMMLIDDTVSDQELEFCKNVAKKMEFSKEYVPDIVNTIMKRIKNGESKNLVCKALVDAV